MNNNYHDTYRDIISMHSISNEYVTEHRHRSKTLI